MSHTTLSVKDNKVDLIKVRVTPEDKSRLRATAQALNMGMSEYIRTLLTDKKEMLHDHM